ncbi:hypothetical protein AAC691_21865 [Nguyenibacter vanlangensis]|uniref:Uncharacterized protein n=1 Tax=Nguyenibacter vanlangensis TaxID=1216886 RepID=A0ABZ3D4Z2_9PROT
MGALGIGFCLIADGLQTVDAVFQSRVVDVRDTRLDGVVEAFLA